MKRVIWLTVALTSAACGAEEPGRLPLGDAPAEVVVSSAQRAPALESFPATVVSERTAEIATRMSGTVDAVLVDVGSQVVAGQTLVALDATDVQARVSAAGAGADLAQRSYDRVSALAADGAASQHELDQVTAALQGAQAQLAEAEAQQAYAVVKAPFAGVVTQRHVDGGDLANPGHPLLTLVAPGALKVVADIPAHRAGTVKAGDAVMVRIPGGGEDLVLHASVTRSVPALGPGSRTFRLEAVLAHAPDDVIPGSFARMEIVRPGEGPRWLPADAVVQRGQLTGVYTVESDTLRLRWVRLGQEREGAVELLSGPMPMGDLTVVRRPQADLYDGQSISGVRTEGFDVAVSQAPPVMAASQEVAG